MSCHALLREYKSLLATSRNSHLSIPTFNFDPLMRTWNRTETGCYQQYGDWYTGRWWVGCYIWYTARRGLRGPLLAVTNVTTLPSTASVPTSYAMWQCGTIITLIINGCLMRGGRTLVFDRRTFPVLRSTCSWWVTTYVSKPSPVGERTRSIKLFILSGQMTG